MDATVYKVNSAIIPDKVIEKIESFGELNEGWDYGAGMPAKSGTVQFAIDLYKYFRFIGFNSDATPRTDGGITLILYKGEYFIDLIIHPNFQVDIRKETGIGINYEVKQEKNNVSLDTIKAALNETYFECISFEPSISKNTVRVKGDSKVIASPFMEEEYLSSDKTVQYLLQVQSATI